MSEPKKRPDHTFGIYYTLSTFDYDGSHMQIKLHQQDLAADVINMPMHGGGYMHERGRWIFDYFGSGGGQSTERKGRGVEAGGGSGGFNVGYGTTFLGVLRIYPFVGVGGYGMGVTMASETPNDDPQTLLAVGGPQGQVGIGAELRLGGKWGIILGVRLGYHYLLGEGGMSRVPFMRLLLGIGRLR